MCLRACVPVCIVCAHVPLCVCASYSVCHVSLSACVHLCIPVCVYLRVPKGGEQAAQSPRGRLRAGGARGGHRGKGTTVTEGRTPLFLPLL